MIPMTIGRIKSLKSTNWEVWKSPVSDLGTLKIRTAALRTRSTLLENWHIKIVKASLTGVYSEY